LREHGRSASHIYVATESQDGSHAKEMAMTYARKSLVSLDEAIPNRATIS